MKSTSQPLPVTVEVFRTMVRMHDQRFTYAEIGAAVGMTAQEVEDLRWKHLDRWLHERETIGRALRSDLVMAVVARIQLVMSITENPKDIALLTKAMDGILKHDTIKKPRPPKAETPTTPTPEPSAPAPLTATTPAPPQPVALTPTELAGLQRLRDECPTNTELLYKMQQVPTLYDKCMQLGSLPMIEKPEPEPRPPTPRVRPPWTYRLLTSVVYVLVAVNVVFWTARLRTYFDERAVVERAQPHPPNR